MTTSQSNKAKQAAELIGVVDSLRDRYLKALCNIAAEHKYHEIKLIGSEMWTEGLLRAIEKAYETPKNATIVDPNRALIRIAKLVNYASTPETISAGWLGGLERSIETMCRENERVGEEHGMLADICDLVFDDENRAEEHGYEGVVDKVKETVDLLRGARDDSNVVGLLRELVDHHRHLLFSHEKRNTANLVNALERFGEIISEWQSLDMMNESHQKGIKRVSEALFGSTKEITRGWDDAVEAINKLKAENEGWKNEPSNFRDALAEIRRLVFSDIDAMAVPAHVDGVVEKTRKVVVRWLSLEQRIQEKDQQIKDLLTFRDAYCDMVLRIPSAVDTVLRDIRYTASENRRRDLITMVRDELMPDESPGVSSPDQSDEPIPMVTRRICGRCESGYNYRTGDGVTARTHCPACRRSNKDDPIERLRSRINDLDDGLCSEIDRRETFEADLLVYRNIIRKLALHIVALSACMDDSPWKGKHKLTDEEKEAIDLL